MAKRTPDCMGHRHPARSLAETYNSGASKYKKKKRGCRTPSWKLDNLDDHKYDYDCNHHEHHFQTSMNINNITAREGSQSGVCTVVIMHPGRMAIRELPPLPLVARAFARVPLVAQHELTWPHRPQLRGAFDTIMAAFGYPIAAFSHRPRGRACLLPSAAQNVNVFRAGHTSRANPASALCQWPSSAAEGIVA